MKISELIEKANEALKKHGDLDIMLVDEWEETFSFDVKCKIETPSKTADELNGIPIPKDQDIKIFVIS